MISIIIPCYNCSPFLADTLKSIQEQSYQDFEIIVIDDGSTDQTAEVVKGFHDPRLYYFYQSNAGVSKARNYGLKKATRKYVVFFDGDDKMTRDFLEVRLNFLEHHPEYGFCCGAIETFPGKREKLYGTATEVSKDLLLYNPYAASCPSNYMIRKEILTENHLGFNEYLSSTADRFFLLQLANKTKGKLVEGGQLLYRISANSMSNKLSLKLVDDNERFLIEVKKFDLIPDELENPFMFRINYILGLSYLKLKVWPKGLKYTGQALCQHPIHFMFKIFS